MPDADPKRNGFPFRLRLLLLALTAGIAPISDAGGAEHSRYLVHLNGNWELTERINVRVEQAERTVEILDRLAHDEEPVLFMGDLNDDWHPLTVLREAGFTDSFMALGQMPVATHPALPLADCPPRIYDWMLHRGPIRPILTAVVDAYVGDLPGSDHKPVATTYRVEATPRSGDLG